MTKSKRLVALFLPGLYEGGAERIMLNLAEGITQRGCAVDLLLAQAEGPYMDQVPASVRLVPLKTRSLSAFRTTAALPGLVRYLRREQPDALLSALNANFVALCAKHLARNKGRLVVSEHNTFSVQNRHFPFLLKRLVPLLVKALYPWADGIVAVSDGVAADLSLATRIPRDRIRVIYNPVVTPELRPKSKASLDDPWFKSGEPPVILTVGRLTPQKDLGTLIEAFARVRRSRSVRLLILGEGEDRLRLQALVERLSLSGDVRLAGFVPNPYSYMASASLFVLSSRWEGLPTVLVEALHCGTRVISTDCPSGPREILREGRYGTLVPVGDVHALADAMERSLDDPAPPPPHESWQPFTLESAVNQYLDILLGN